MDDDDNDEIQSTLDFRQRFIEFVYGSAIVNFYLVRRCRHPYHYNRYEVHANCRIIRLMSPAAKWMDGKLILRRIASDVKPVRFSAIQSGC